MNARISYTLSEAGRKALILSGGDGNADQTIVLESDHPLFRRIVELGSVESDHVSLSLRHQYYETANGLPEQDEPRTAEYLLAALAEKHAAKAAKAAREEQECREATEAVLRERKTETRVCIYGADRPETRAEYQIPAWPSPRHLATIESPEAVAWVAELKVQEDAAKAKAEAADAAFRDEAKVKADAAAAEKEAARLARRAERGLQEGEISLDVAQGALSQVPAGCWESHSRGKNWLAKISINPSSPGGIARDFFAKAKGEFYYLVDGLDAGDPIEFGADYYSGRGRKSPTRWYGYVVRVTAEYVVLREASTAKAAIKAAAKAVEVAP